MSVLCYAHLHLYLGSNKKTPLSNVIRIRFPIVSVFGNLKVLFDAF